MGAHASTARARVLALEEKGWLWRDAIQAVSTAFVKATNEGKPVATVKIKPPACVGAPLASRSDARTCGSGACRSKAYRRQRREERRRERTATLFSQLLRR
jgi:hypothetical protein